MRGKEGVEGDRKGRVGGGERETRQEQGSPHERHPLPAKRLPIKKGGGGVGREPSEGGRN